MKTSFQNENTPAVLETQKQEHSASACEPESEAGCSPCTFQDECKR